MTPDEMQADAASVDAAGLLNRIHAFTRRFICYPSDHASTSHVLWIAHTHLMEAWFSTPRLAVLSPEPGSGKSRVLEITAMLVPNPLLSVNSSAAYILWKVSDQANRPTILYDEIDTIFGPAARGNEDLRGMVNAGYRRGAVVGRCNTERGKVQPVELATYAAVAMGGLGNLPDTIMSRSIIIRMRKRAAGEKAEPFQPRIHELQAEALRIELAEWAASIAGLAEMAQPAMPDCIADRNADVWGPLFAVADLAGGTWPEAVRMAATDAVLSAKASERPSLGAQLLADIHACFGNADRITTVDLLDRLLDDDEAPWGDLRGRKIDARKLAEMLREYGIRSSTIRMPNGQTPKGYKREAFHDAWKRYLPVSPARTTSATSDTYHANPDVTGDGTVLEYNMPAACGGKSG
ncbi:hypothetical protein SJA_C1-31600 [Sphingobium indicum UT26S]|uniref:DUF3631 domain-containing protein n=2 Tax=Sphingomonadaceae TaxID=41297 RepID=D4Z5W2_SPHIU|nr:hypothetical protein SJA_C1-31600 [Sphingobium indicum UT26S]